MNPAGVVLVIAGIWGVAQVWRGDALARLRLIGA